MYNPPKKEKKIKFKNTMELNIILTIFFGKKVIA